MGNSNIVRIGDIAEVFDGPHATPKKIDVGPVFLSISSLENGQLDLSKSAHISDEQFEKWTRRVTPREGDVLFSYETRLGEAALMPGGIKACLGRRMGLLRPKRNRVLPEYLLYAYLSPEFQKQIKRRTNHGATVERISLKELPDFEIRVPSIEEQQKVVQVIKAFPRKLEVNQQTNQTLEQMAQALFKSWFVDFDPVVDNALAAGNPIPDELVHRVEVRKKAHALPDFQPLPEHIRNLFPSEFEQTGEPNVGINGWVPKGWSMARLGGVISVKRGGSPRPIKDYIVSDGLPWTKISDATGSHTRFIKKTKEFIKPEGLSKTTLLQKGTLILSNSATPGLPMFLDLDACVHDGWLHFPEKKQLSDLFLFQLFQEIRPQLIQQGNGSVFTNLKTDILKNHKLPLPTSDVIDAFDKIVGPMHMKLHSLSNSNSSLENLRNYLLPKLISGEIQLDSSGSSINQEADVQGV